MTSSDAEFEKLISDAGEWAAQDPDPITAAALSELTGLASSGVAAARQQLEDSFSGTLQFGTAGLRAALGPGPNRMNRVVVRRAAAGLAAFLKDAVEAAWAVVDPVLRKHHRVRPYKRGTWGPKDANTLITPNGPWHNPARKGMPE